MSKCIVKILRDETPGGLAEQRNKEIPVILKIALLERIAEEWQRTQTDK